jgi:type II secretory pathway component PulF
MKIFLDFRMRPPTATRVLVDALTLLGDYWYVVVLVFLGVVAAALVTLRRRGSWGALHSSVASFVFPRLEAPGILRNLAQAVVCRQPLSFGIEALEVHHPHRGIRRRMRKLREQIAHGNKGFEPLADSRLLSRREVEALACAERAGNLAWVLESIAENIERRHRSIVEWFVETVQPVIIAIVGLLVCGICVGIFYPIIELIQVTL